MVVRSLVCLSVVALVVSGCGRGGNANRLALEDVPDPGLSFVGEFGRQRANCRLLGTTPFTEPFQAPGRVLVACPAGAPGGFELVEAGASQVGRTRNFNLYSVPVSSPPPAASEAQPVLIEG